MEDGCVLRLSLPVKDHISANAVRRKMRDLVTNLQQVFISKKLEQDLRPKEIKSSIVNQKCVVYLFSCDLCDADYVGYTARHVHQRIAEHAPFGSPRTQSSSTKANFEFSKRAEGNLIASSMRCFV